MRWWSEGVVMKWATVRGRGWFVLPVEEVLERNARAVRDGAVPSLVVCGEFESMDGALRLARDLKREEKARRVAGAEATSLHADVRGEVSDG